MADPQDVVDVPAGFLTRADIEANWGTLFPTTEDRSTPPPQLHLNPASVDMHLGSEYYVQSAGNPTHLSEDDPYLTIPSGEFALLMTWERVHIPHNLLALITMKVTHKQSGLINVSGFHVDPGFRGQIFFSVYNAGPSSIGLKLRDPVFTIFFAKLGHTTRGYEGIHQDQEALPPSVVQALGGPAERLVRLERRLDSLQQSLRLGAGFAVGVLIPVAGIVGFVLGEVFR